MDHDDSLPRRLIKLTDIEILPEFRARKEAVNESHVAEMSDAYRGEKKVPRPRVCEGPGGAVVLTRGEHRVRAAMRAGVTHLEFEVLKVDRLGLAKIDAAGSNTGHGLKRTNADKRQAVELCLDSGEPLTARQIADVCEVDSTFVDNVKAELAAIDAVKDDAPGVPTNSTPEPAGESRTVKEERAATVAVLIKKDPGRSDEDIAAQVVVTQPGTKPEHVARVRKTLQKAGKIDAPARTKAPKTRGEDAPAAPTQSAQIGTPFPPEAAFNDPYGKLVRVVDQGEAATGDKEKAATVRQLLAAAHRAMAEWRAAAAPDRKAG